jgi:hypothetical protein
MTARAPRIAAVLLTVVSSVVLAQAPIIPAGASPAKAKELATLLQAKKLESYAVRDPEETGRFVAVFLIPNVNLLLVAATHERPTDMEYWIYNKDFKSAYADLRSSILAKRKVTVEDAFCDGLVAQPPKNQLPDVMTVEAAKHNFDGIFADPKKRDLKKISLEDYTKNFTADDQQYQRMLGVLVDDLKKAG